jgi:branched-subunit amino acid transport protein
MSPVWPILAMGGALYLLRLGGMLLPNLTLPAGWERALGWVPVALLSALVVSSLAGPAASDPRPIVAAAVGAAVAWRTRRMWACMLSGLLVAGLLRLA